MSTAKYNCDNCNKITDAAPCEASWGETDDDGNYNTESSIGPVCPECAVTWLFENCMSAEETKKLAWELAEQFGRNP